MTPLRLGAVDARKLSGQLSFVKNKHAWSIYLRGSLANFGRRIPESDYRLIFEELAKPSIPYQVRPALKPKVPSVAEVPKRS